MGELDDLCDAVAEAIGIPAWEVNTVGACDALIKIRNRAESAESALAIAREELSKARSDSRALAGLWRFCDGYTFTTSAAPRGLTEADLKALEGAVDSVRELQDAEVVALLRRAVGLEGP